MNASRQPAGPEPGGRPPHAVRARWWPAALILALAALAVVQVRFLGEYSNQERNVRTMITGIGATVLLLAWFLLLSGLPWRVRWLGLTGLAGVAVLLAVMFELHGVTGDILPVFRFRWRSPSSWATRPTLGTAPNTPRAPPPISLMALSNSYPQFLGPSRNATVLNGPKLARDWATRPPRLLWRQPIGPAWSGFAVQGLRAVTQEQHEGEECVVGYDLLTGKVVWSHADVARYATTIAGEGPRATPTIVNGRVFALGATGLLNCLDLATGKAIWRRDIVADSHGRVQQWGMAGSPLVFGSLVIVNPGGKAGYSLVAYRTDTGDMVWAAGDDEASYSSPCAGLIGGVSQIVIFNQHAVFGHDPITGRVLWRYPWPSGHPHIAQPLILPGNRLLVSSGYGTGSELVQIRRHEADEFRAERLWKTKHLKAKFNNPVVRDNYVFGLDDGVLVCLDLATGEPRWKSGRYGHGQFVLVPDLLLLTAENGEVALLDPVPVERRELARFSALRGKTWNPPALVGDLLLVRNDQEAACYQLPTEP